LAGCQYNIELSAHDYNQLDLMPESYFTAAQNARDKAPHRYRFSRLQRRILEEGLAAHWRAQLKRASGLAVPEFFTTHNILLTYYGVAKEDLNRLYARCVEAQEDNREARERLAAPRAALSRALRQFVERGLVQRLGEARGPRDHRWHLSAAGIKTARWLCPELTPPTKAEINRELKLIAEKLKRLGQVEAALSRGNSSVG
jgi:DNA-binding MarR family transcriptional regulator